MTLPILGPMSLTGFAHAWWFLFLFVVLGLVAYYVIVQRARKQRVLRFANMELLESVAPKQPTRWRHLPAALLAANDERRVSARVTKVRAGSVSRVKSISTAANNTGSIA